LHRKHWISAALLVAASAAGGVNVSAASHHTRYVSPSALPTNSDKSCSTASFTSIQAAVNASSPGDTVRVCAGTYDEQVSIAVTNLTVTGAGTASTIIEPTTASHPSPTTHPNLDSGLPVVPIVYIAPGTTGVTFQQLTVEGSMLSSFFTSCADNYVGIWFDEASGKVAHTAIKDLVLPAGLHGCQDGDGFFAYSPSGSANVTLTQSTVTNYDKNGVTCNDTGTFCRINNNTVTGSGPDPFAAENGVQIAFGAGGVVSRNTVTGNLCDDTGAGCNGDPLTGVQSIGILVFNSPSATPAGTTVETNTVSGNDLGIYTDDGISVKYNNASANRYIGLFIDADATGAVVEHNKADSMTTAGGGYGIYVNSNSGNEYETNEASGSTPYDLYANNAPSNTYDDNTCGTAFPSKTQWDC
jgi:hypothetical protein